MKIFNWFNRKFSNKEDSTTENVSSSVIGGGILSIGTMGYDELKDDVPSLAHYVEEEYEESEMAMEYDDEMSDEMIISDDESEKHEQEEEIKGVVYNNKREFEYVMVEKKERVTLGDLFCDDDNKQTTRTYNNDVKKGSAAAAGKSMMNEKASTAANHTHTHTQKKLKSLQDPRPIRKLHQVTEMMRRMLKRKIHPHLTPLHSKASLIPTTHHQDTM